MVFERKLTDQQSEQVVTLHLQGKTLTEIGPMFDVSRVTIGRILRKHGIVTTLVHELLPLPDETALAYLAGLFDGEGSVNIFKQPNKKERITPRHFLEIGIINTHKGVLQWVLETFGGRFGLEQDPARHHRTWRWRASSSEACDVLLAILPYLRVKKEQAELAIDFQKRIQSFKAGKHNPITQEEIDWRESQRIKLSTMRFWKDDDEE